MLSLPKNYWRIHHLNPLRNGLGAVIGIACCGLSSLIAAEMVHGPMPVFAAMGASAVLGFAVPSSPLAQPWSILGGNLLSAAVGLTIGGLISPAWLAGGLAVGLAIIVMQGLKCLHPPGGAVALITASLHLTSLDQAIGGVFLPLGVSLSVLLTIACLYNNLTGRRYPHRPVEVAPVPLTPVLAYDPADLAAVLDELDELPDIDVDDLDAILRAVVARQQARQLPRQVA